MPRGGSFQLTLFQLKMFKKKGMNKFQPEYKLLPGKSFGLLMGDANTRGQGCFM